ncbi:cysteine-rich CWC family protein [Rubrivivax albus]|uniref:Cysteine-rich CWC family protein n=1 Tax=Rubrivivax albus TaxID=2499835 RepID=A0A3S2TLN6_9BURK|nr:cysteine-rich CWC family protein [Rubrivivax albus]RVT50969.1 hypothetical protein ENE75_14335 [Rubrivivax albus]
MDDTECADTPDARCPRCGQAFHCGMQDAAPCGCTTVQLPAATLAMLRARYTGCLCLRCLQALAAGDAVSAAPAAAPSSAR